MKLLRVHIIEAETCGGLLDGLDIWFRSPTTTEYSGFDPLCLIGPNGTGKSQFLQVLTEIFQAIYHVCAPQEERTDGNPSLQFEVEYLIRPKNQKAPVHVLVSRQSVNKRRPQLTIVKKKDDQWVECNPSEKLTRELLPSKVVGYTSGENETLSLPFLLSRSEYATDVGKSALNDLVETVPDTRLLLIDYGTNLEVVVSNLLLNRGEQLKALLDDARLKDIHSFRCIIQLAHSAAPKASGKKKGNPDRKGIQLTPELEKYLAQLQSCATCYSKDDKNEIYIFDFWVNDQTKSAFRHFWQSTLELYTSLHKLSMLNDLVIKGVTRDRFKRDTEKRRFASRLPEPQDEDKVFRFDQVRFVAKTADIKVVDYVSLSDGEHQLVQLLGIFSMLSFHNVLFVLDEPESHLNPQWRVKFISRLLGLPTKGGIRGEEKDSPVAEQDCLLTTHAPFVPSDMARKKVFIFGKRDDGSVAVRHPEIETYGTTFDTILEECFNVRPPISGVSLQEIEALMKSDSPDEIRNGMERLGHSVEKVFLADRLQQLTLKGK